MINYKQLTIEQIKIIVNNCEEHTVRQIAKMKGLEIDPTIVYFFLLHIGISKPFGGEDFVKYVERKESKRVPKIPPPKNYEPAPTRIIRPKAEYSNMGNFNLTK